jgi:hypothetical protein
MEGFFILVWIAFWIWIATKPWDRDVYLTDEEFDDEIKKINKKLESKKQPKQPKQPDQPQVRVKPTKVKNRIKKKNRPVIKPTISPHDLIVQCYLANRETEFELAVDNYVQSELYDYHYECSDSFDELNIGDLKQYEDDMLKADETCPPDEVGVELIEDDYLKSFWEQIQFIVQTKGVHLFHFTDRSNIRIIKKHGGLYSWSELNSRGIKAPKPGGSDFSRQLDLRRNLQDHVRLCFHPDQPMKYVAQKDGRIPDPVILKINPEVLYWDTTLYSDVNATASNANVGGTLTEFRRIDFDLCNRGEWVGEDEKHRFQAEVLVETYLPIDFILNIDDF